MEVPIAAITDDVSPLGVALRLESLWSNFFLNLAGARTESLDFRSHEHSTPANRPLSHHMPF